MKNDLGRDDFRVRQTDDDSVTLQVTDIVNFEKTKKILDSGCVRYHSFTPKDQRPRNLILKGVYGGFNENDVLADINSIGNPNINVIKLAKVSFNNARKGSTTSMYNSPPAATRTHSGGGG